MRALEVPRYLLAAVAIVALGASLTAATAGATRVISGNLVLDVGLDFAPRALPRTDDAPIRVWGYEKLRTKDGSVPSPATHVAFEFTKDGRVETRGLPTCPGEKLAATTTARAISACPDAIVGRGFANVTIAFPEQAPILESTPLLFFNAPPIAGDPTLIVHAYLSKPTPTTYMDSFRIKRINRGNLGYRVESDLSKIAGGYGSVPYFRFKIDRKWRYKGETLSFLNGHCAVPDRPRIIVHAETRFADGSVLTGSHYASCKAR